MLDVMHNVGPGCLRIRVVLATQKREWRYTFYLILSAYIMNHHHQAWKRSQVTQPANAEESESGA